jgi:hypothetical protein
MSTTTRHGHQLKVLFCNGSKGGFESPARAGSAAVPALREYKRVIKINANCETNCATTGLVTGLPNKCKCLNNISRIVKNVAL